MLEVAAEEPRMAPPAPRVAGPAHRWGQTRLLRDREQLLRHAQWLHMGAIDGGQCGVYSRILTLRGHDSTR